MTQMPLPTRPRFDGSTYDADRDFERLNAQLRRVALVMADGEWRTLAQIAALTHDHEQSVSARLRDLRKPRNGGHTVERRYVSNGLFEYRFTRAQG